MEKMKETKKNLIKVSYGSIEDDITDIPVEIHDISEKEDVIKEEKAG